MGVTTCVHHETIEPQPGQRGIELGTCTTCGQITRYDRREVGSKPAIIKLGRIGDDIVLPPSNIKPDLTTQEMGELEKARKTPKPPVAAEERPPTPAPVPEPEKETAEIKPEDYPREKKLEIATYAKLTSLKDAEKEFGVRLTMIRSWVMQFSKPGQPLSEKPAPASAITAPEHAKDKLPDIRKRAKKCNKKCGHYYEVEGQPYCDTLYCPSHYPRTLRLPYRPKGKQILLPEPAATPEPAVDNTGVAELISGVAQLADIIKNISRKGPSMLPELPPWNDKWKKGVKIAWLETYRALREKELEVIYGRYDGH